LYISGQVVNVLREDQAPRLGNLCPQVTSHITIPAWYKSGITLFVRKETDAHRELLALPEELPIKSEKQLESTSSTSSSLRHLFVESSPEGDKGPTPAKERDSPS
jgi:hypothetical protein